MNRLFISAIEFLGGTLHVLLSTNNYVLEILKNN
jgi:hypothetical protein